MYSNSMPPEYRYPSLANETRELVPTDCAAFHLHRAPQTLREWSCLGTGLLRPVRIGARLAWRTADIRNLLGVESMVSKENWKPEIESVTSRLTQGLPLRTSGTIAEAIQGNKK